MNSYGIAQEAIVSPDKPRWWMHRRVWAVLGLAVLIAISLSLVGTPEETLLLALDGDSGRTQWSMPAPLGADDESIGIPVAANGRLYVSVITPPPDMLLLPRYQWELRALDASSGSQVWTFKPDSAQFGTLAAQITEAFAPIATPDTIYVSLTSLDYQTWLVALDAQTGQPRWQQQNLYFSDSSFRGLSGMILSTAHYPRLAVAEGQVFTLLRTDVAGDNNVIPVTLTALNAQTGQPLWSSPLSIDATNPDIVTRSVLSDGRKVYVTLDKTYVFDAQTGASQPSEDAAQMLITDDGIYRLQTNALIVEDRVTGQLRWQFPLAADFGCSGFAVGQQSVYTFCTHAQADKDKTDTDDDDKPPEQWENFLLALDVKTGTEQWRKPIAENLFTVLTQTPATFGDRVAAVGGVLSQLRVIAYTSNGDQVWSYHLARSYDQAVTDGSRIFVIDTRPRWRGWLAWINPAWR